ncbi:MAG: PhnD/SsuA/transferrin family substrate-binding protein, partial [Thermodesulfobacteriota bacterium]
KVRIIEKSEWYGFTPLVVRKGFDQELKDRLRNILFNMRDDPEGSRILEGYGFDGFVNPHDSIYDGIREIMEFISSFEAAMESK